MMIDYNDKTFRPVSNTANGDVNEETLFHYQQQSFLVSATYGGGQVLFGHLIGLANAEGMMEISYHHITQEGNIRTGICVTKPELLPDGRIRLHENWRWTNGGDEAVEGQSVLEEV